MKLQLQWFTQAQFAGLLRGPGPGLLQGPGPRRRDPRGRRRHRAADRSSPTAQADYAIAWVPKALATREQGADITDVAQVFQRSGTLQVSFKDKNITAPADLKGKKVGNWGFGNEFELFAGMTKAGLDPASDVTLVQQQFDMQALLKGDIDAAAGDDLQRVRAGARGENPETGQLYQPDDFNVINWNDDGHRDAAGRDLGQHRAARVRRGLPGHDGQVPHGVAQGLDRTAATTSRRAATSSWRRARSSARATSCGR